MDPTSLFGPLDLLYPVIEWLLLVLVLANLGTRFLAHRSHVQQYSNGGADAMKRHPVHLATNLLLLAGAFYYMTVEFGSGVVLTLFVVALVFSDIFEFEARLAEARSDNPLEPPKSALAASAVTTFYVAYLALFFVVRPIWDSVIVG